MSTILSTLDYVLLQFGNPGRYQMFLAFLLCALQLPISFTGHLWRFYADEPSHRCYIKSEFRNGTREEDWIPKESYRVNRGTFSSCIMYNDPFNHWKGTRACRDGWEYRPFEDELNVIMEWDLVCERKYLITLLFYISNIAAILGLLAFGLMADHFERKRTLLFALFFFISVALPLHFVQDFASFCISYSLQSFFISGVQICSFVLLMEILPTPYQLNASIYALMFTILASTILPLLVWTIKNWRYIQLAISAPSIVFFLHIWILPQSLLWLILKGRIHETENLLEQLSKQNGKSIAPNFRLQLRNFLNLIEYTNVVKEKHHQMLSKFSSPLLRWNLLTYFYLYFVLSLGIEVTDSQVLRLHETKFADHVFRGIMDLGTTILVYFCATRMGPRAVQATLFIIAGLLMMASITLQEFLPNSVNNISIVDYRLLLLPSTLVCVACTLMKSLPALVWYHTVKTLPTGIRAIGLGACCCWGVVGQMVAPNLLILADLIAPFIPIGLCGSLSVIAGGLSVLFPNLWRKPLPNTLSEIEKTKKPSPSSSRYYNYSDLKKAQLKYNNGNGSVYTMNGKENGDYDIGDQRLLNQLTGLYKDEANLNISNLEEELNQGNWHLYSVDNRPCDENVKSDDSEKSFRDMHIFPSSLNYMKDEHLPGCFVNNNNPLQNVAETNL